MMRRSTLFHSTGIYLGLTAFVFLTCAPLVWMIVTSLLPQRTLITVPLHIGWSDFTFSNYTNVILSAHQLYVGLGNSFIISLSTTALAVVLGAPAAYALARLRVRGSGAIMLMVLTAQMFPAVVIVIPLFVAAARLGLIDTKLNLILVYLSFNLPVVIWVLRGFFLGLPEGLERAARVDGASVLQTFWYIILPVSLPALSAAAIFAFIEAWNEFFLALIMTRQESVTVPLVISAFAGQYRTLFGEMMASAVISISPVILMTIMLRNLIIRGFADGLLKG
ncbi:carbohydrate ABC transporter permease [Rhizobium mongolense]|uniref:Multiple sugar transport system permease protein n=1 Tax=Rhizobium mongolense TaxID=57676 RepID=A0A7W6RSC8_9HYPH|nr:carbohydrate ABC transporter permease [Rhizobium mongolense]MBB4277723.1 multiple sugar transport system permease protein [Rhizobium mongolense]